ncbi:unnamed protein product [Amoebophrya sp. A120]|nr:unnamed protein product [Amoebophrya sp. A120]|eukprot:GSA120T00025181001.1
MKLTKEEREQMQLSGGGAAPPSTQDKNDSRNYCTSQQQELETACWLDFLEADVRGEVTLHTPPELQQSSQKQDQSTSCGASTSSSTSSRQKSRLAFEWMMSIGYKISCPCYGGFIDVAGSFSVVDFCSEYYYDGDYEMKRMEDLVAEEKMQLLNESKSTKSSPDEQQEDEERKMTSIAVDRSALAEKNLKKSNGPQVTCFVDEGSIQEWKGYFPPGMFVKMHKRLVGLLQTQGIYMVREMLVHDWIEAVRDRYEVDI